MYTLYKFHFLNGISEINKLFDDILIIWLAPVHVHLNKIEYREKVHNYFVTFQKVKHSYILDSLHVK